MPEETHTLNLTPRQAKLLLDGVRQLAWLGSEVPNIAPVIAQLEAIPPAQVGEGG